MISYDIERYRRQKEKCKNGSCLLPALLVPPGNISQFQTGKIAEIINTTILQLYKVFYLNDCANGDFIINRPGFVSGINEQQLMKI